MFTKIKQLLGISVEAIDGRVGEVVDLYFDEAQWAVRYAVVHLSSDETDRNFLIAPLAIGRIDWEQMMLPVSLSLKKILRSPEIEIDLPISRQYELALRRYYEWPEYWGQTSFLDNPESKGEMEEPPVTLDEVGEPIDNTDALLIDEGEEDEGKLVTDTSMAEIPEEPDEDKVGDLEFGRSEEEVTYGSQLRSVAELSGYQIQTETGDAGSVVDFIFDDSDWSIKYLVIDTQGHDSGNLVLLSLHWIRDLSWRMSMIFVTINREDLVNTPPFDPRKPLTRDFEQKLFDYYDKLNY